MHMAIRVIHTITVTPVDDPTKFYKFDVRCSCQWQALTHSKDRVDMYIESHKTAQERYGNEVRVLPHTEAFEVEVKQDGN